jgi:hypothetical protein
MISMSSFDVNVLVGQLDVDVPAPELVVDPDVTASDASNETDLEMQSKKATK